MSLYNLLHGTNQLAPLLLAILGIDQEDGKFSSGRFRDIHLNEDGTRIVLYTRNGGGNREEYQRIFDVFAADHPQYQRDWDDDFDCTYAYIEFTVPELWLKHCQTLADLSGNKKPETVAEKFATTIAEMQTMSTEQVQTDPRFKPVCDVLSKITTGMNA